MRNNYIPYIIGITGHRDIQEDCLDFVTQQLNQFFKELKSKLPNTPLYLMSPLAEGADRLAANIALQHNITLITPLPMEKEEYLKDFRNQQSIQEFDTLFAQSQQDYFIGYAPGNHQDQIKNRAAQYQKVGEHIADRCNFLIALWDQQTLDKTGGTSQIIAHKRKGNEHRLFDGLDGNAIQIIPVIRQASDHKQQTLQALEPEILGQKVNSKEKYQQILTEIDNTNKILSEHITQNKSNTHLYQQMSQHFSDIADIFQTSFKNASLILVIMSWFVILCLEILHNFNIEWLMIPYALFISAAFGYFFIKEKKGRNKDFFIFLRGLSEALRVQNYWYQAGIQDSVAKYYFRKNYFRIAWMKMALKNIYTLNHYITRLPQKENLKQVKRDWIDNQLAYYSHAITSRNKKYKQLEKLDKRLYKSGLFFSALTFFVFLMRFNYEHLTTFITYAQLGSIFHTTLFLAGMSLISAAFIGEKYLHQAAYKEDINNFEIMKTVFSKAKMLLEEGETDEKFILKQLGKEVLDENSYWVALHYNRKLKVSMG